MTRELFGHEAPKHPVGACVRIRPCYNSATRRRDLDDDLTGSLCTVLEDCGAEARLSFVHRNDEVRVNWGRVEAAS